MKAPGPDSSRPIVDPPDRQAWHSWLEANHSTSSGIWLLIRKKDSLKPGVSLAEAVEEALCFGWIDSRANVHDADHFKLRMAPRKPKSVWSKINKARVEDLIGRGLMTPSGLVKVEAARQDGSWNVHDDVEALEVPDDLARALDALPGARRNFEAFGASYRKMSLYRIKRAKRPETRLKRVEEVARLAVDNRKADWYDNRKVKDH